MPFEDDVVRFYATLALSKPGDPFKVFVSEDADGILVGFLVAVHSPYLYCRGFLASQEILYVLPEFRGTSAAVRLMKAFAVWADETGAYEIYTGVSNGMNMERTSRFFQKLGYTHVGHYLRKVNDALQH